MGIGEANAELLTSARAVMGDIVSDAYVACKGDDGHLYRDCSERSSYDDVNVVIVLNDSKAVSFWNAEWSLLGTALESLSRITSNWSEPE